MSVHTHNEREENLEAALPVSGCLLSASAYDSDIPREFLQPFILEVGPASQEGGSALLLQATETSEDLLSYGRKGPPCL